MKKNYNVLISKLKKLKDLIKPFFKSAFTVAELVIVMVILAFLVFILLGFMNRDQQKEFDAKIDKTVANISALVDQSSIQETGKPNDRYSAQAILKLITYGNSSADEENNDKERLLRFNVVKSAEACGENPTSCWNAATVVVDGETINLTDADKILLNDGTSLAFLTGGEGVPDRVFIDANGPKSPNQFNRDIKLLNYVNLQRTAATVNPVRPTPPSPTPCLCDDGSACPDGTVSSCPVPVPPSCSLTTCPAGQHLVNADSADCSCVKNCTKTCASGQVLKNPDSENCTCENVCAAPNIKRGENCCPKAPDGTNTRWKNASGCDLCPRPSMYAYAQWKNNDYGCETECKSSTNPTFNRPYANDLSRWCCPKQPNGANQKWGTECNICSKPNNSSWSNKNSTSCAWTCNSGYIKSTDGKSCVKCQSSGKISGKGTVYLCEGTYLWSNREGNRNNSIRTNGSVGSWKWSNDTCANGSCCCKCSEPDNDTFGPVPKGGAAYSYNISSSYVNYGSKSEVNKYCTSSKSGHY